MPLKLMYITNRTDVAKVAERNGVDRIFVDMECIGKELRQRGMDTVKSFHTIEDVANIRRSISKSELLVRCNPIHNFVDGYDSTESEIEQIICHGADIIMLPYFKTCFEVERFLNAVNGRTKTMLLLETPKAVDILDDILQIQGIDEIHIGLNDLSIGYRKKFMFELLEDGTVESICMKIHRAGIPYGFGGISAIGSGMLPAEYILKEHYRMGSSGVILSRSFCNYDAIDDIDEIEKIFRDGIFNIRRLEEEISVHSKYFENNKNLIKLCVAQINGV